MECSKYLKNFIYSDYKVDDRYQGFFRCDKQANWGRAVSLIDIPSQVGKAVIGTAASLGTSSYHLLAGGVSIVCLLPTSIVWLGAYLSNSKCEKGLMLKTASLLQFGLKNVGQGLATLTIGIPATLLWRVFLIVADLLGILLPEIGRWARHLTKIANAMMNVYVYVPVAERTGLPIEEVHERRSRTGPQYTHNFKPQADLVGELTVQGALEILGLKEGATLQEVKKAAHKLYLRHHPDKGGEAENFRQTKDAHEFLRENLISDDLSFFETEEGKFVN